jgi:hypothetical protein
MAAGNDRQGKTFGSVMALRMDTTFISAATHS